jgi:hypothetical protein
VTRTPRIELLHVADCPLVDRVRATVEGCLADAGIGAAVHEREGLFASPTLLIDGRDVVTGAPVQAQASCRLDLPTPKQILAALNPSAP